jgi:hypothetical protein
MMLINQYPKPKLKKQRKAKNNPVPTINDICRYCQNTYASTHEVFEGTGRRQLSIKYKLQVKVCNDCHGDIQLHPLTGRDLELKKEFQQKFIDTYGYELWMKIFMRDYSGM